MNSIDHKLRERVKELNCLYAISKVAWEANDDIAVVMNKVLDIVPRAMQYPGLAEAKIEFEGSSISSAGFKKCSYFISAPLSNKRKKYGIIQIGYRKPSAGARPIFLKEEKHLINAVAQELSLLIRRASIEKDKQKLQIQLQHVERLAFVGELSAGIAHELNEPLGRILGFAQLIKKGGKLSEQQSEDIERIIKASLYTREIIKKLMIFSRQMPQQIVNVNVNNIIDNILYFIDVRFHSRGIHISKDLDPDLPSIKADEVQISQVLVNLITNSVYAMPQGGQIVVKTRVKGNDLVLSVKDSGTGMTPDVKARIFEPFFTTKPVGQGTGLGLSVVQGIIDSHEGRVVVTSQPGKGSKFEILLPLKKKTNKK